MKTNLIERKIERDSRITSFKREQINRNTIIWFLPVSIIHNFNVDGRGYESAKEKKKQESRVYPIISLTVELW